MVCHVHVMDRKSCRNKRRKKKLLTNHNMGHMIQKENYTVTSHCSLGGFCPALEISFKVCINRFPTFTKSQICNGSLDKTSSHAQRM